jgi:hypothetical protein
VPVRLANTLERHPQTNGSAFMFPSPTGNREQNMLRLCKAFAERTGLDPAVFNLGRVAQGVPAKSSQRRARLRG